MASAIVNKLMHHPTTRLRAEAGRGPLGDAAAALFGLEEPEPAPQAVPQPAAEPARGGGASSGGDGRSIGDGEVLPLVRNG